MAAEGRLEALRDRWRVLALLRHVGPVGRAAAAGYVLLRTVVPLLFVWSAGLFVGRVVDAGTTRLTVGDVVWVLVLLGLLFTLQEVMAALQSPLRGLVTGQINAALRGRVIRDALRGRRAEYLHDAEVRAALDQLRALGQDSNTPGSAAAGVVFVAGEYGAALLAAGYLAVSWWYLALLMLFAGLVVRFTYRSRLMELIRAYGAAAEPRQLAGYYSRLGLELSGAKEIRVFGLERWLADRHEESGLAGTVSSRTERGRRTVPRLALAYASGVAAAVTVLVVLARSGVSGATGVPELAVLVPVAFMVLGVGRFYEAWDFDIEFGTAALPALATLRQRAVAGSGDDVPADAPRIADGVRLDGVTYRYTADGPQVLAGVDLSIPLGRSLAIVGANGAGKTTLVKLICGLYEPTGGRVLVDGGQRPDDAARRQAHTAVIFQDYLRYDATAADNIGFGAVAHLDDRAGVRDAARRAGVLDVLDALPDGLDTVLSSENEGGVSLSGGQWQRVALARALFAVDHGCQLLIMDEPTASLDVPGEAAFFDLLLELAGATTVIIISHRLSTVRRAEHICVLDGGRIVEHGSHDELMGGTTRYREMFDLQASYFQASTDTAGAHP